MPDIYKLLSVCRSPNKIYIQTHNFPDHDAVASAFGLQQLFASQGIDSAIIYDLDIQRDSLKSMIQGLNIQMISAGECDINPEDLIILVDGCKGNKNMTDLPGREIAVIDHHQVKNPESMPFSDIRPKYGACATIICEYYAELGLPLPCDVATAFMIGISIDTTFLTRGVTPEDLNAYARCFDTADTDYVGSILSNTIEADDIPSYKFLLNNLICRDNWAFCFFDTGCSQNLLGILASFVLSLDNVDFAVLCARNGDRTLLSVRNEDANANASDAIQWMLEGIGFGGGHAEMAGGFILGADHVDKEMLLNRMRSYLIKTGILEK